MINRTMLELLQKSRDGKAALMMRKAAELLVKVRAEVEFLAWLHATDCCTRAMSA